MKLLRLFHQAERFPVPLRMGHTKIALEILLCVAALLLSNDGDRLPVKHSQAPNNGRIIPVLPVSMKLDKTIEDSVNVLRRRGPSLHSGQANSLP